MLAKRFLKFHETLQQSRKMSVRFLSELSARCDGPVTSWNVQNNFKYAPVPDEEKWKIEIVKKLLEVNWKIENFLSNG